MFQKEGATIREKRTRLFVLQSFAAVALFIPASLPLALEWQVRNLAVALVYLNAISIVGTLRNRWLSEKRADVTADLKGLWLGGACVLPRASISSGELHRRGSVVYVRFERRWGCLDVVVDGDAEGRAERGRERAARQFVRIRPPGRTGMMLRPTSSRMRRSHSASQFARNRAASISGWHRAGWLKLDARAFPTQVSTSASVGERSSFQSVKQRRTHSFVSSGW